MNKLRFSIGLVSVCSAIGLAAQLTACRTTENVTQGVGTNAPVTNIVRTLDVGLSCMVITNVAKPLMPLAVKECPQCRKFFADAVLAIDIALGKGEYDPTSVLAAIQSTGVREIQSPDVQALIQGLIGAYTIYYGDVVRQKLDRTEWAVPVLKALRNVLQDGANAPIWPTPDGASINRQRTFLVKTPMPGLVLEVAMDTAPGSGEPQWIWHLNDTQ